MPADDLSNRRRLAWRLGIISVWLTMALNLAPVLVRLVMYRLNAYTINFHLLFVTLVLTAVAGLATLWRRPTRPVAIGLVCGTLLSAVVVAVVVVVFFVSYFLIGRNELS